jgi:hypothetical protein
MKGNVVEIGHEHITTLKEFMSIKEGAAVRISGEFEGRSFHEDEGTVDYVCDPASPLNEIHVEFHDDPRNGWYFHFDDDFIDNTKMIIVSNPQ